MTGALRPGRLFVYGSLAPGRSHAHLLARVPGRWRRATVRGRLHPRGWGLTEGFPAFAPDPRAPPVPGHVLLSRRLPAHWRPLDRFEGEAYERCRVDARLRDGTVVQAVAYVLRLDTGRPADRDRWLEGLREIPRWGEARNLLTRPGTIAVEHRRTPGLVVWSPRERIGAVIDEPEIGAVLRAARDCDALLASPENVDRVRAVLPDFAAMRAPCPPDLPSGRIAVWVLTRPGTHA